MGASVGPQWRVSPRDEAVAGSRGRVFNLKKEATPKAAVVID